MFIHLVSNRFFKCLFIFMNQSNNLLLTSVAHNLFYYLFLIEMFLVLTKATKAVSMK